MGHTEVVATQAEESKDEESGLVLAPPELEADLLETLEQIAERNIRV